LYHSPEYAVLFCMVAPLDDNYPTSLHDALPILRMRSARSAATSGCRRRFFSASLFPDPDSPCEFWARSHPSGLPSCATATTSSLDRKSTRLNSSHEWISYAVFCLKKKISTEEQP